MAIPNTTTLRRSGVHGKLQRMRLNSILANHHVYDGEINGKPHPVLLMFDGDRSLRVRVAGDGYQLIVDDGLLDAPVDIGECGQITVADVTELLFPGLRGLEVTGLVGLFLHAKRVGMKITGADGRVIHFWAAGDELHWGDETAFANHDWLDGVRPMAGEHIDF